MSGIDTTKPRKNPIYTPVQKIYYSALVNVTRNAISIRLLTELSLNVLMKKNGYLYFSVGFHDTVIKMKTMIYQTFLN